MAVLVLLVALALVVGACVCVVWAQRGGPRWVRAVAAVTLGVGEVVRFLGRSSSGSGKSGSSSSDD
ncbi:hypothetical protein OG828_32100 [Streptomyces sp. NBC_00457]|uniref:hypothetical protein n=1 Tax=unclassified Streptomyces TaxID=2593676 RepID=UPI002E1ED8BE|nr:MULTISPECIES: hypothetical protein [unclassified Streptomyces]